MRLKNFDKLLQEYKDNQAPDNFVGFFFIRLSHLHLKYLNIQNLSSTSGTN